MQIKVVLVMLAFAAFVQIAGCYLAYSGKEIGEASLTLYRMS